MKCSRLYSVEVWMNLRVIQLRISHVTDASATPSYVDEGGISVWLHILILQFILLAASLLAFLDKTCSTLPLTGYIVLLHCAS